MKFPPTFKVYGDQSFRGPCPPESAEQITFFNELRRLYPETLGVIATHVRNEGKRHYMQVAKQKAEGMTKGAADILIPGTPCFVCELKRQDHTKSRFQDGQIKYLETAQAGGSFVCIALGYVAALEAVKIWESKK